MKLRRIVSVPARGAIRLLAKSEAASKVIEQSASKLESMIRLANTQISDILAQNVQPSTRPGDVSVQDYQDDGLYGASYFGEGRNPQSREGISGYESYTRESSNANLQAFTTWSVFECTKSLDVGCALGWSVEAFRERGFDTTGVEYSKFAVDHCAPGASGHIYQGDLIQGLSFGDGEFELVTAFEILEHLPPESIDKAISELRRVTSRYLFATIPTFGPNKYGPDGWLYGKVRDEKLAYYDAQRNTFKGPVPYKDLMRDKNGNPVEGHLTIASFDWWQERFQACGFERCGALEERIYPVIDALGLVGFWNLHVYKVPGVPDPPVDLRSPTEIADLEARWAIDTRKQIVADNF